MHRIEPTTLTRQELYNRVWATPMRKLCREFGLSDVGLAKVCKAHEVPYPPRGYWAKVRNGVSVRKPALKPVSDPRLDKIHFHRPPAPEPDEQAASAAAREKEPPIPVADALADPHPLVERTLRSLLAAKIGADGLARPRASRCLDVHVSPAQFDRAARILDALVKALDSRGYPVLVGDEEPAKTWVTVLGEKVSLRIEEGVERRERIESFFSHRHEYDAAPNGQLALRIDDTIGSGCRRQWSDGKKCLEAQLASVVAGMVRAAEKTIAVREQNAQRERERKEEERRRKEAEERQRQEHARVQDFNNKVAAWERAERIRAFVAAVRAAAGRVEAGSEMDRWLAWAARRADRIDPLTTDRPENQWPPPAGYRVKLSDQRQYGWSTYDYDGTPVVPPGSPASPSAGERGTAG